MPDLPLVEVDFLEVSEEIVLDTTPLETESPQEQE